MKLQNALLCVLLVILGNAFSLSAQVTYSKLYTTEYSRRDISYGMVLTDEGIIINAKQSCWETDNVFPSCTIINQFSYEGEL